METARLKSAISPIKTVFYFQLGENSSWNWAQADALRKHKDTLFMMISPSISNSIATGEMLRNKYAGSPVFIASIWKPAW